MGWKGTVRSVGAAIRAAERESRRRQREAEREARRIHKELERQAKELQKELELQQAAYEVEIFESKVESLTSLHKECSNPMDWKKIRDMPAPQAPSRTAFMENEALKDFDMYQPSLLDKLLRRDQKIRAELRQKISEARSQDDAIFRQEMKKHEESCRDWEDSRDFAERVLDKDVETYNEAIAEINPFEEIGELGSSVSFTAEGPDVITSSVFIHSEEVVPHETKSLLSSGKLSVKRMPKTRFYEIYQDYVCSALLRVAGEIFALLPVSWVIATAKDDILNTATGYLEEQSILSVVMPRETFEKLNLARVDPSDALSNFVHRMSFKKTKGFSPIEEIALEELSL